MFRITDAVRFCYDFDLVLKHDKSENSYSPEVFKGLIIYTDVIGTLLKDNLENNIVFKHSSENIQNDLFNAILGVCQKHTIKV